MVNLYLVMKKFLSTFIALMALSLLLVGPVSATSQTVTLKPTSAELGVARVFINGSAEPTLRVGSGALNLNNVLTEDGQVATLDPEIVGPGDNQNNSIVFLDYDKTVICSEASIEQVKVNSIWRVEGSYVQPLTFAGLALDSGAEAARSFEVAVDTSSSVSNYISTIFGGLVPLGFNQGGTYSGSPPSTLTKESSATQIVPTATQLNNPDTFLVVSMGEMIEEEGGSQKVVGYLDYADLEVTYDDSNCSPEGIDPATIAPPKTGVALTAGIIGAGLLALIGATIFGAKRTKLKHRVSERE